MVGRLRLCRALFAIGRGGWESGSQVLFCLPRSPIGAASVGIAVVWPFLWPAIAWVMDRHVRHH